MASNHFLHQFHGHLILKIVKSNIPLFSINYFPLFYFSSKCTTMNNLILCSNNDELSVVTIPTTINDTNVITRHIKISNKIEQIRILYESSTRSILSINIQIKSNGFYSIVTEKNLVGQQILEASAIEQKLNFYVSNINEQTLSNTRSYSVELPENMGGIEYLSYSIVKHTQLVTLRMQDGSLLVIKLAENGGMHLS